MCQEVGLILDRIRRHGKPDLAARVPCWIPQKPCVVPRAYPVKCATEMARQMLIEGAEFHPAGATEGFSSAQPLLQVRVAANVPFRPHSAATGMHCLQSAINLELQRMSGFGVRPALISSRQCDTTRCQYCSVKGTTSSGTPASWHTYAQQSANLKEDHKDGIRYSDADMLPKCATPWLVQTAKENM